MQASVACAPEPRQMSAAAWAKPASSLSESSDFRSLLVRQKASWQSGPALTKASSSAPSAQRSSAASSAPAEIGPEIAERAAQRLAVADQMMQTRDRAVLLGFDDLKLRAASWAHGAGWC
jgi:monoamine oxidase